MGADEANIFIKVGDLNARFSLLSEILSGASYTPRLRTMRNFSVKWFSRLVRPSGVIACRRLGKSPDTLFVPAASSREQRDHAHTHAREAYLRRAAANLTDGDFWLLLPHVWWLMRDLWENRSTENHELMNDHRDLLKCRSHRHYPQTNWCRDMAFPCTTILLRHKHAFSKDTHAKLPII